MGQNNYIPPCVDCEDVIAEIQDEFDVSFTEFQHEQQTATITEDGQYHFYGDYIVDVNVEKPLPKYTIIVNQNGEYNFVGNISIKVDVSVSIVYKVRLYNSVDINKMAIIKFYKEALGLGLREAKDYVESLNLDYGTSVELPETFETYDGAYAFGASGILNSTINFEVIDVQQETAPPEIEIKRIQLYSFQVKDTCIDDTGVYAGEVLDTKNIVSFRTAFASCKKLVSIDTSNWDTSNATDVTAIFDACSNLQSIDTRGWDLSNAINVTAMFRACTSLQSIIGGATIDEVLDDYISCLNGLKISANLFAGANNIDRASLRALVNGLAEVETTQILTLGATLRAKLTEEDIAIATNKGWSIS